MRLPVDHAFVCAMPIEMEPIVASLNLAPQMDAGIPLWTGDVDGQRVVGVVTGMGPALAGAGIDALLDIFAPQRVAVVGITGAVHEDAPIGALVQVTAVIDGATGARYLPAAVGSPAGAAPDLDWVGSAVVGGGDGGASIPAGAGVGRGAECGNRVGGDGGGSILAGALWTTAVVITDPGEIRGLGQQGVVAMDMETAVIARRCMEAGVPWSVFRTVSDVATDGSVGEYVAHLAAPDGSVDPGRRDVYFAAHPERVEPMQRLAQNVLLACDAAAGAAVSSLLGAQRVKRWGRGVGGSAGTAPFGGRLWCGSRTPGRHSAAVGWRPGRVAFEGGFRAIEAPFDL